MFLVDNKSDEFRAVKEKFDETSGVAKTFEVKYVVRI